MIVTAYYFNGSTSVKRILSSRIHDAKAMDDTPNPVETDRTAPKDRMNIWAASSVGRSAVTQFAPHSGQ
jgi:hypothetical protein